MHKYVAVLPALAAVVLLSPQLTCADNNIGCLFSDTLCNQDREWCFDDQAFGHCLSDYGHYSSEDLYKYALGSEELRVLEQEMQRLFLLGYRWSHTYTQCVLQTLLRSFRDGVEFDISTCNGDLDQDLEGALKAIEGEELVDPRDLAIVRFTPSVTDPHSDYADEVYFPPIREEMLSSHLDSSGGLHQESNGKEHEGISDQGLSSHPQDSPPTSQNSQTNSIHSSVSKLLQVQPSTLDDGHGAPQDDNNLAPNYIHSYLDHTNEANLQRPQPYSKRGYMDTRGQDLDLSNYTPRLSSKNIFLTYDRDRDSSSSGNRYRDDDRQPFDEQFMRDEEEEENRDEVFGEEPTRPMYAEGGMQFVPQVESNRGVMEDDDEGSWSNMPEVFPGGSMVQQNYGGYRGMPGDLQGYRGRMRNIPDYNSMRNLPSDPQEYSSISNYPGYGMRGAPDDYRYQDMGGLSDDLQPYGDLQAPRGSLRMASGSPMGGMSGYGNMRSPWNMALPPRNVMGMPDIWEQQSLRGPMSLDGSPWGYRRYGGVPRGSYAYQPPRRDAPMQRLLMEGYPNQVSQQEADLMPYNFGSQLNSLEGYDEEDQDYGDYGMLGDYSDYDQYDDNQFGRPRTFPYMQKFVKKDEETIGSDYGDLAALGPWSFQREERQDVKKPGPFFNSKNNYAFRNYNQRFPQDTYRQPEIAPLMVPRRYQWQKFFPTSGLWSTGGMFRGLQAPRAFYSMQPTMQQGPGSKDVPDLLLEEEKLVEEAAEDVEAQSTIQPETAEEELKEVKEEEEVKEGGGGGEGEEGEEGSGKPADNSGEETQTDEGGKEAKEEKQEEEGAVKEEGKEEEVEEEEERPSPPSAPWPSAPPSPGIFRFHHN
ncbi:uncharacterized protein LOC135089324 isoform X2 [Scylla paramamosain]|uniref:uncharacterized protein LOC135089324 isoform X2 n=1 Tax=Scylla paramamosain TaxID=85552 RepID=UPI003083704E